ncbi:hypothetical protein [Adhaeribacter pallidiroseus]|uniref:Uncharacterized protein n=1 Tax=Adhaeribacter pallidiroseus TaxID=2072847 RepID=A0A369QTR8_9BACT|nr:hypothetical protein [Adhaeribacter pallidiroseus]RDC66209.1 hypothetical protein AHMF7616_04840 [Adhaeribacter pallidiroseus]
MNITDRKYFQEYHEQIGKDIEKLAANFDFKEQTGNLSYATQASAVYSANIEGNRIDLNTFGGLNFLLKNLNRRKYYKKLITWLRLTNGCKKIV